MRCPACRGCIHCAKLHREGSVKYKRGRSMLLFLIVATAAAAASGENTGTGCEVPISSKRHFLYQWPLVFHPNGELHTTSKDAQGEITVQVPDGAQVLLSCGPNYLKQHHRKEVLNVRCHGESRNFSVIADEGKNVEASPAVKDIKEYACDLRVIEEVLSPVSGCDNEQWTGTSFGYVDPTKQLTYLLGEACYDTQKGRTIFTHVKLGTDVYLQKLDKNYLTLHQHPDGRYKIELFRGLHFDKIYELIRTQLHSRSAPHLKLANYIDDALLSNAQYQAAKKLSWNYFVAVDELQVLDTLKSDIKRLSAQHELDVYVGSHGVKTLKGTNGEEMQLYLQQAVQRFPAPELIWIIVQKQQKAVAFVLHNAKEDALQADTPKAAPLCSSHCDQITWLSLREVSSSTKNVLLCCEYKELKGTIEELPQLEQVNGLLME